MAHLLSGCYRFGFEAFGISPGASLPPELNVICRLSNVYSKEYVDSVSDTDWNNPAMIWGVSCRKSTCSDYSLSWHWFDSRTRCIFVVVCRHLPDKEKLQCVGQISLFNLKAYCHSFSSHELPRAHARSFVGAYSYFQQRSDTLSLMQVSDHYGRVHYAPIEFEQLLKPLIPEFLAADVDRAVDIRIEPSSVRCFITLIHSPFLQWSFYRGVCYFAIYPKVPVRQLHLPDVTLPLAAQLAKRCSDRVKISRVNQAQFPSAGSICLPRPNALLLPAIRTATSN